MLLKPPEGWHTNNPERSMQMPNGSILRLNEQGAYDFSNHPHLVEHYKRQGFREPEPEKPAPSYRDDYEREAVEHPLSIAQIIALAESLRAQLKIERGRLFVRGDTVSPQLRAHLHAQRERVIAELRRRAVLRWEEIR